VAWIQQEDLTQNIQGAEGAATEEELMALGMTNDKVVSITCAVCHDPHDVGKSSGDPNTATVRIDGDTPMLPAGFRAMGVGNGALCMTCHNTRNGSHNDAVTETADDRAPHTAAQADVLMGQNAFFVAVGERGAHSLISNTCSNCHMSQTPPPADLSYNLGGTNHDFAATDESCSECHGAMDGDGVREATGTMEEELKAAIEQALADEILAQIEQGNTVTLVGMGEGGADVELGEGTAVTAIELSESHGRAAMNITIGETVIEHVRLGSDTLVKGPGGAEVGNLTASEAGQVIAKAAWNFFLIEGDGSHGIHNPTFTLEVLENAIQALEGLAVEAAAEG